MREWTQTLELASGSIRHLHWRGDLRYLAGVFNIVARTIASTAAESAAPLQGAAQRLATTTTTSGPDTAPSTSAPISSATPGREGRPAGAVGLIAELRRETTGLLRDTLGERRLHELRAQGEAMNTDEAVACALDAITHTQQLAQE